MTLKQQKIFDKAIEIFGEISESKKDEIINVIKRTYDIELVDYSDDMIKNLLNDIIYDSNLFEKRIIPNFSIFDTKQGTWKDRRLIWDEYLGDSTFGRKENLTFSKSLKYGEKDTGTSRFDSVLTELVYRWFCLESGIVFDPFCGGHIRGTVASLLGLRYLGIDLAKNQIDANLKLKETLNLQNVKWINDDSLNCDTYLDDNSVDLIFTCPPYGNLEQYTNDPRDLSNMNYKDFIIVYKKILEKSSKKLKNNRFFVIVVGDFRDKETHFYNGFVKDTIQILMDIEMGLYNEIILANNITTASMRANLCWNNRKMVKIHQNILVFYKGDPKTIKNIYPFKIESKLPIKTNQQNSLL